RGGGALDGALGVVAGIEAVSSLWQRFGRSTRILECVAICEEEGSRFNTNFWGARAIADRLEPGEPDRVRDADGVSLGDAMPCVGASALALGLAWAGVRMGAPAVATGGTIVAEPSQVNVVPGLAKFTVDTRHPDPARRGELITQIGDVSKKVASERNLGVEIK